MASRGKKVSKTEKEGRALWRRLNQRERDVCCRLAADRGIPIGGSGFFGFLKKAAKAVAPHVIGVVTNAATSALTKRLGGGCSKGGALRLAGRGPGRRVMPKRDPRTGRFVARR